MLIITKYHGPTDHHGARISARCYSRRITIPYDDELDANENHHEAARKLALETGMFGQWYFAETFAADGNVYVRGEPMRSPAFTVKSRKPIAGGR